MFLLWQQADVNLYCCLFYYITYKYTITPNEIKQFVYESSVSGINFQKKMDVKPVSKEEFYRKKVKPISPKL